MFIVAIVQQTKNTIHGGNKNEGSYERKLWRRYFGIQCC